MVLVCALRTQNLSDISEIEYVCIHRSMGCESRGIYNADEDQVVFVMMGIFFILVNTPSLPSSLQIFRIGPACKFALDNSYIASDISSIR